jgi:hypothetical protein
MKTFEIQATSSLYWQGECGEESIPIAFTISKLLSPFLKKNSLSHRKGLDSANNVGSGIKNGLQTSPETGK